jgi:hypothetical protein
MAGKKKVSASTVSGSKVCESVDPLQSYVLGVAKMLVDRIYGPDGLPWGTRLTELEDVCLAVREMLTEEMLKLALQRQAESKDRPEPYRHCPGCEGAAESRPKLEPRGMHTRVGEAKWDEPNEYCPRCRRSFFPSEQEFGG